jgi:hypothetical protein
MNGVHGHPPLFTKVMGRPKKNKKKASEEKIKKGVKLVTKHGILMHCSFVESRTIIRKVMTSIPKFNKLSNMKQ